MNQVWHIRDGHLVWHPPFQQNEARAIGFKAAPKHEDGALNTVHLRTCSEKEGQRFRKFEVWDDQSFLLRDEDAKQCLASNGLQQQQSLTLGDCGAALRFVEDPRKHHIKSQEMGTCLDASDYKIPELRHCYGTRTQKFKADEKNGWVKVLHAWEDNGRKRYYERCLDSKPAKLKTLSVHPCDAAVDRGVRWKRINTREPIEARIWSKTVKPGPGDP